MNKYNRKKEYVKTRIKRNRRRKRKRRFITFILISIILIISIIKITKIIDEKVMSNEEFNTNTGFGEDDNFKKGSIESKVIDILKEEKNKHGILKNIDEYPKEILELLIKNPETIDYVGDYLKRYPAKGNGSDINVEKDYVKGEIPLFLQWDKRWGYYDYGNKPMAMTGCGPTALSMVVVGLTGDITMNPKKVADISYKQGYLVENKGSSWTLMSEGARYFGLRARELPLTENNIKITLKRGVPIVASMGPGEFTTTGHYIVLTDITEDGKILVNDPNSRKRSDMKWAIDVFMEETKNLWEFKKL
ncbi:MAG: hypothetical protein FH753_12205 [Firmicutes bacterium]|nr:hypothetical protein [Bacillota bacterium]